MELSNRFTRAVSVGNPRGYTQGDKESQEVAETCTRLINNGIICWNSPPPKKNICLNIAAFWGQNPP
ncbi:Tn3 family transposase [Desulforhopalus sp. 52FAK]